MLTRWAKTTEEGEGEVGGQREGYWGMVQRGRGEAQRDRTGEGKRVGGGDQAEERKSENWVNNQKIRHERRKKKQGVRERKRETEVVRWRTHSIWQPWQPRQVHGKHGGYETGEHGTKENSKSSSEWLPLWWRTLLFNSNNLWWIFFILLLFWQRLFLFAL